MPCNLCESTRHSFDAPAVVLFSEDSWKFYPFALIHDLLLPMTKWSTHASSLGPVLCLQCISLFLHMLPRDKPPTPAAADTVWNWSGCYCLIFVLNFHVFSRKNKKIQNNQKPKKKMHWRAEMTDLEAAQCYWEKCGKGRTLYAIKAGGMETHARKPFHHVGSNRGSA